MIERYVRIQPECVTQGGPRALRVSAIQTVRLAAAGDAVILQAVTVGLTTVDIARFDAKQAWEAISALLRLQALIQDTTVRLYEIGPYSLHYTEYPDVSVMHGALAGGSMACPSITEVGADA